MEPRPLVLSNNAVPSPDNRLSGRVWPLWSSILAITNLWTPTLSSLCCHMSSIFECWLIPVIPAPSQPPPQNCLDSCVWLSLIVLSNVRPRKCNLSVNGHQWWLTISIQTQHTFSIVKIQMGCLKQRTIRLKLDETDLSWWYCSAYYVRSAFQSNQSSFFDHSSYQNNLLSVFPAAGVHLFF